MPFPYLQVTGNKFISIRSASVRQMGIIEPIVCRQDAQTGRLYVVAAVPVVFIEGSNYAEIALVKNLLRQDLNPVSVCKIR